MSNEGLFLGLSLWQVLLSIVIISLPVFYRMYSAVKYYVKLTIFYITALIAAVVVIFYSLPRPRNWRNHIFVRLTCRYFLRPLFGLEIVARGLENITKEVAGIVVINHQSSIDLIPLFGNWPDNTVCLAKKEIWYTGTFGLGAWLCGTVYIDRGNSVKARKTMDDTMETIRREQLKVVVFPEGTRNHSGSMLPFKRGAFHIAVQAQVPIIPVVLSSYDAFYSKPGKRFDEGKMVMEALPSISTEGMTSADVANLTETTRNRMMECFERISREARESTVNLLEKSK